MNSKHTRSSRTTAVTSAHPSTGTFLLLIGILNLVVLLDILGVFRQMKQGAYNEQKLEEALQSQGLMSRFFLKRVGDKIDASWKMYPLGILFGLGFDTATEIGAACDRRRRRHPRACPSSRSSRCRSSSPPA